MILSAGKRYTASVVREGKFICLGKGKVNDNIIDFPLDELLRTDSGDVIVPVTTDETDPSSVFPFGDRPWWRWPGGVFTQFWKKSAGKYQPDLRIRVNARKVYWASTQAIPGGISFENFEFQERFYPGQEFVYGIIQGSIVI